MKDGTKASVKKGKKEKAQVKNLPIKIMPALWRMAYEF